VILRVQILLAGVLALGCSAAASAQPADPSRKWEILDNSFLVEEAFNQETGVFQNIFSWTREPGGEWQANFTQEWPARGVEHQFSYSLPVARDSATVVEDVALNYRYQLSTEGPGRAAVSPRASIVLPTGLAHTGHDHAGFQLNVPASKQFGNLYVHANGGFSWIRDMNRTATAGGSLIWRAAPMLNLMMEAVSDVGSSFTASPGLRRGWNLAGGQLVFGAAVPMTRADRRTTVALLTYCSFEHAFR
jgi:hypothetical protein